MARETRDAGPHEALACADTREIVLAVHEQAKGGDWQSVRGVSRATQARERWEKEIKGAKEE